jgi:acyl carrier protein
LDSDATTRIVTILEQHARLGRNADDLAPEDSLYDAGMTSHASVSVMLALEDAFDIEFPDSMLSRRVFESIASIRDAVYDLTASKLD